MYPAADVPVVEMSLLQSLDAQVGLLPFSLNSLQALPAASPVAASEASCFIRPCIIAVKCVPCFCTSSDAVAKHVNASSYTAAHGTVRWTPAGYPCHSDLLRVACFAMIPFQPHRSNACEVMWSTVVCMSTAVNSCIGHGKLLDLQSVHLLAVRVLSDG